MELINDDTAFGRLRHWADMDDCKTTTPEAYMAWLLAITTDTKYKPELQSVAKAVYDAALNAGATEAIVTDAIKAFDARYEQHYQAWINTQ